MSNVKDLKVGQRGTCRGRAGELMTVDRPTEQVVFRADEPREQPVSSDGVRRAPLADLTVHASEFSAAPAAEPETAVAGLRGAAVPTKGQITAAREKARVLGSAEGLSGQKLEDVQDKAEADLVSRMARGEAA